MRGVRVMREGSEGDVRGGRVMCEGSECDVM